MKTKITLMALCIGLGFCLHAQNENVRGAWYVAYKPDFTGLNADLTKLQAEGINFKGVLVAFPWSQIQPNAPAGFTTDYEWGDFDAILKNIAITHSLKIGLMIFAGNNSPIGFINTNSQNPIYPPNMASFALESGSGTWLRDKIRVFTTSDSRDNDFDDPGPDHDVDADNDGYKYRQDIWPDYLNPNPIGGETETYFMFWKDMINALITHLKSPDAAGYLNNILFFQSCEGSTGDEVPYKGTPRKINSTDPAPPIISDYQWKVGDGITGGSQTNLGFMAKSWYYLYTQLNQNLQSVKLLVNTGLSNTLYGIKNGTSDEYNLNIDQVKGVVPNYPMPTSLFAWTSSNLNDPAYPVWRKANNMGHWFQQNFENDFSHVFDSMNVANQSIDILTRDELDFGNQTAGAIPENILPIGESAIHGGLDMWMIKRPQILTGPSTNPSLINTNKYIINFFSDYVKQKNPANETNAFCALREGIDAVTLNRITVCTSPNPGLANGYLYNLNSSTAFNNTCYLNKIQSILINNTMINDDLYDRGAKLATGAGNPENELFGNPFKQYTAGTKNFVNDVGWYIYPGNYEKNLTEVDANGGANVTSHGYWNVLAPDPDNAGYNQPYGIFCRGISSDYTTNSNSMSFKMNPTFSGNITVTGTSPKIINYIAVKITYLNDNTLKDGSNTTHKGGSLKFIYKDQRGSGATTMLSQTFAEVNTPRWESWVIELTGNNSMVLATAQPWDFQLKNQTAYGNGTARDLKIAMFEILNVCKSTYNCVSSIVAPNTQTNSVTPTNTLLIQPNPASNWFDVQTKNKETIKTVSVYNAEGKLVYQKQPNTVSYRVNNSSLNNAKGVFFVIVETASGSYKQPVTVF